MAPGHRELMLSARRMTRSSFLNLPEGLQDQVIEGLDRGELTMVAAADLIRQAGHDLSHEGVANYYQAVRRERRAFEITDSLTRLVEQFKGLATEDAMKTLLNLALASSIQGVADGTVGIKDLDLARMMAVMPREAESARSGEEPRIQAGGKQLSPEALDKIRKEIYGL